MRKGTAYIGNHLKLDLIKCQPGFNLVNLNKIKKLTSRKCAEFICRTNSGEDRKCNHSLISRRRFRVKWELINPCGRIHSS